MPLTGTTLRASLKMRCDTSGASSAIFWANVDGKLVVAGDYVTDARKAELKDKKMDSSYAQESESITIDANGDGPLATVLKTGTPLFVGDISKSSMKRKELAAKYGVKQACFVPFEAGILEFTSATMDWKEMPECPTMPKAAMRKGFENLGASYCLFWTPDGDKFKCVADYTTDARREALKQMRKDDKTFSSESRKCSDIMVNGDGPIATAAKTGKEVTVTDVSTLKRAALAKEFGIARMHFEPVEGGVFEYGSPANQYLSGPVLEASLKMRCDTSGASYAMYWKESDGKLTVAGSYVTDARKEEIKKMGLKMSFAEASKDTVLSTDGNGPVGTVMKTREPVYIQDINTCDTMKRKGLAKEYGIASVCFVPVPGGVMEYGVTTGDCSADWKSIEDARQAIMPKAELEAAFKGGATHVTFWQPEGDKFVWGAGYTLPERLRALANAGKKSCFSAESSKFSFPVDGKGPVATAARSGKEVVIVDPADDANFKRAAVAKEYGIGNLHFVPCKDGVLEYGLGKMVRMV